MQLMSKPYVPTAQMQRTAPRTLPFIRALLRSLHMNHAVLSAIGPDRPGLVEEVSQFIFERGGNIETSRMVNLGGQFCVMMLVSAAAHAYEHLVRDFGALEQQTGLRVELVPAARAEAAPAGRHTLVASGPDRAGTLHAVSHLLRVLGITIQTVNTRVMPASDTEPGRFEMEMAIAIPPAFPMNKLAEYL